MAFATVEVDAVGAVFGVRVVAVLVAVIALVMTLAVLAVISVGVPGSLAFIRRQTGIGPLLGGGVIVVFAVSISSVFALGGTTPDLSDLGPLATTLGNLGFLATMVIHIAGLFLTGVGIATAPSYVRVRRAAHRDAYAVEAGERVAVEGTAVVADGTARTPYTSTEALCYEAHALTHRGEDAGGVEDESLGFGGDWRPEQFDDDRVPFGVDDGTGRVFADPAGADLRLDQTEQFVVAADGDHPDYSSDFPSEHWSDVGDDAGDRRYVEATLHPGDPVAVVGTAVTSDDELGGSTRVDADAGIVAAGDLDDLERVLHRKVVHSGAKGLAMALVGYAGMLLVSGAG